MTEFAVPTPLEWREAAIKALKERPLESLIHLDADHLATKPLYGAANGGEPVFAPRPSDSEGRAWDVRALNEGEDADALNRAILTDLENGAASVLIAGPVAADAAKLARALDGVALELAPVALDAGFEGVKAAEALSAVAKGSPRAKLAFHLDPISAYAEAGGAPVDFAVLMAETAKAAATHAATYPEATLFMASGRVAHEAGGSIAQELAFAASSAVAYVKAAVAAGLTAEAALKGVVLGVAVDQAYFDSLAKIRALRLIWASVSKAFGAEVPAIIEARSSRRMLSARDPWPNMLRLTAAGFAGAVGGADAVVLDGFTRAAGLPDDFAKRQARNTQLILMEESNLGRVDDPASGSWYLDARTRELAEAAWTEFQVYEAEGGVIACLEGGVIQPRIARAREMTEKAFKDGAAQIVGVTKFVDLDVRPAPVTPPPVAPAAVGTFEALAPVRFAAAFEEAAQ
ncbi:methylmalonyl-CoA mutase family protein [Brevundimonas diminuta]|uniref:methylmalonyl-CoA mutase family protein n=1 Tax=Brevundimonas diminuta TaxID=293 RepID=UPI0022AF9B53|nr:methylmalonyl-CoA mutase family protein [Brevundimonas diminuta]MCZ4108520.1 methylmalonyl-CoA mutase family protein [Brevundimonas diminuta]